MQLLNEVLDTVGGDNLRKIGKQLGLDESDLGRVLEQVVPALGQGLKRNTQGAGGLDSLAGALSSGGHQRYLGDIDAVLSGAGISEGNGILGHIFGSKDVSRKVAGQAAAATGVKDDVIKQLLPMVATLVMGTLNRKTDSGAQLGTGGANPLGGLAGLLDSDGDGSSLDDILGFAKKLF